MQAPLAVGGTRLRWDDLPPHVQAAVETAAGSPVRAATSQPGGFSPGVASVLRLADGRSVFLKAVNAARNADSPAMHRREARILGALAAGLPVPRLLSCYDDGDWVALLIEAVEGRTPAQPWRPSELDTFLEVAARLVGQLTPAPVAAPTIQEHFADAFTGWRWLAGEPGAADRLTPWVRRRLDQLAEIERGWPQAGAGATLLHADLRADNLLLTAGGAVVVDWPHACIGAGWADLLFALPSVAMQGGNPERLWRRYPPAREADPAAVTTLLTAATGYFIRQSQLPPPPNLPRVRAFQCAQGEAGLAWLRQRLETR